MDSSPCQRTPLNPAFMTAPWTPEQAQAALTDPQRNHPGLLTAMWGPAAWTFLHAITFSYPQTPGEADKVRFQTFWNTLQGLLPCPNCRTHFGQHTATGGIMQLTAKDLSSRAALVNYVYRFHQGVSATLGKTFALPFETMVQRFETCRALCEPLDPGKSPAHAGPVPAPAGPATDTFVASAPADQLPCTMALATRQEAFRVVYHLRQSPDLLVMDTEKWLPMLLDWTLYHRWVQIYLNPEGPWVAQYTCIRNPGPGQRLTWTWADALQAAHLWARTTCHKNNACFTCVEAIRTQCPPTWAQRDEHAGWALRQWRLQDGPRDAWTTDQGFPVPHPLELALLYWRCTATCPWQARKSLEILERHINA